jgi:hypothetical protein
MMSESHHVIGRVLITCVLAAAVLPVLPQKARANNDDTVKYMTDMERQKAESGCTGQPVPEKLFADDFQGTAPSGERYDKAKALQRDSSLSERECHLDEAKVSFFGDNIAIVYGSEQAVVKSQGYPEHTRCLVWTDMWLNRSNNWQIVAAQDTALPCR